MFSLFRAQAFSREKLCQQQQQQGKSEEIALNHFAKFSQSQQIGSRKTEKSVGVKILVKSTVKNKVQR